MAIALIIILIAGGICAIIAMLIYGAASGTGKIADAAAVIGVAMIGAAAVVYAGVITDESNRMASEVSNESNRTIGINAVLAQVERVVDTHQGARSCAQYINDTNLVSNLVKNIVPSSLPESGIKTLCLSSFAAALTSKLDEKSLVPAEWLYMREQVLSVINVLELAADYSTADHPLKHKEAQFEGRFLTGQQMLARYLDGMTSKETKTLLNSTSKFLGEFDVDPNKPEKFWMICAVVDCKELPKG
jgi:hypothetical protein